MKGTSFVAVDLGASSGRVILSRWDGSSFTLQELHRFSNDPVTVLGRVHWDVLRLWSEVKAGLANIPKASSDQLAGIAVDTWGVDYVLLDGAGNLLGVLFGGEPGSNGRVVYAVPVPYVTTLLASLNISF